LLEDDHRVVREMFLADESCDFAVVRALREAGFDVTAVGEVWPGAVDDVVFDLAICEGRMVIAEKKDFGRLVLAGRRVTGGVLLLRFLRHGGGYALPGPGVFRWNAYLESSAVAS
jgi:hypothetical protein